MSFHMITGKYDFCMLTGNDSLYMITEIIFCSITGNDKYLKLYVQEFTIAR